MTRLSKDILARLVTAARAAREKAYAPYSKYKVGAAILTRNGSIFTGTNVENATYGATICAERSAVAQMISAGEREPIACAVATGGPRGRVPMRHLSPGPARVRARPADHARRRTTWSPHAARGDARKAPPRRVRREHDKEWT